MSVSKRVKSELNEGDTQEPKGVSGKLLDWFCLVEVGLYINTADYNWNAGLCWNLGDDVISTFPGTWAGFTGGGRAF